MKPLIQCFLAGFLLASTVQAKEPELKVISPDQKYQLVFRRMPDAGDQDGILTWVSICDAGGKVIQQLYKTSFPVIAIKWHKTADAAMILEHIAHEDIMRLVILRNGLWKDVEVDQFKEVHGDVHLVDARSGPSFFRCYYLGHDPSAGKFTACLTEVSISTGKAVLESETSVDEGTLPFYKSSLGNILHQIGAASPDAPFHFKSWPPDGEADWYGFSR